jgi:hypothetical protein
MHYLQRACQCGTNACELTVRIEAAQAIVSLIEIHNFEAVILFPIDPMLVSTVARSSRLTVITIEWFQRLLVESRVFE